MKKLPRENNHLRGCRTLPNIVKNICLKIAKIWAVDNFSRDRIESGFNREDNFIMLFCFLRDGFGILIMVCLIYLMHFNKHITCILQHTYDIANCL
jgi:hypothetical protein